jgi:hypothetical protein
MKIPAIKLPIARTSCNAWLQPNFPLLAPKDAIIGQTKMTAILD